MFVFPCFSRLILAVDESLVYERELHDGVEDGVQAGNDERRSR